MPPAFETMAAAISLNHVYLLHDILKGATYKFSRKKFFMFFFKILKTKPPFFTPKTRLSTLFGQNSLSLCAYLDKIKA